MREETMTLAVAKGIIIAAVVLSGLFFAIAGLVSKRQHDEATPFLILGAISLIGMIALFLL
jgi:hypothetical protein